MRILAILISEGDGLSRRRATTMVGVRGRLRPVEANEESQHEAAEQPRDQNDEQGFHGCLLLIPDQPEATVLGVIRSRWLWPVNYIILY